MVNPENNQFPHFRPYFKNEADRDRIIHNVASILNTNPQGWFQLERQIIPFLLSQSGLMQTLMKENGFLSSVVSNFLMGDKRILIAGGSPGNGKSLLVTELRKYHEIFSNLDSELDYPLAFIPWDKARAEFYKAISSLIGDTVTPPKGVASQEILTLISEVIADASSFVISRYPTARLIVEIPLSGNRGEQVVYEMERNKLPYEIITMFSPQMEEEIIHRGHRDTETSGQPEAMLRIRAEILQKMVGSISLENKIQQDEVIFHYWQMFLMGKQGHIVRWDPNTDRHKFETTRKEFQENEANPDDLTPLPLLPYIRSLYETRLLLLSQRERDNLVGLAGGTK